MEAFALGGGHWPGFGCQRLTGEQSEAEHLALSLRLTALRLVEIAAQQDGDVAEHLLRPLGDIGSRRPLPA